MPCPTGELRYKEKLVTIIKSWLKLGKDHPEVP